MIACFLSNISAKYYKNPSMLSRVIAKNVGDVFFETVYLQVMKGSDDLLSEFWDPLHFSKIYRNRNKHRMWIHLELARRGTEQFSHNFVYLLYVIHPNCDGDKLCFSVLYQYWSLMLSVYCLIGKVAASMSTPPKREHVCLVLNVIRLLMLSLLNGDCDWLVDWLIPQ